MKKNILTLFAATMLLWSCDDQKDPEVYDVTQMLGAPAQLILTEATTSSLTFSWEKVAGAVQYGYVLNDALGNNVAGGTTNETSATISGLDLFSDYEIQVTAIPAVGKGAASAPVSINAKTPFYECVEEEEGYYTSYLTSEDGESWVAVLNEDRSAEDYKEGTFGVFTLQKFYNRSGGSLVFTVNNDNTITILNAMEYDEDSWAKVATGYSIPAARKFVYIDESSSIFDAANTQLSYTAKFANSEVPQTEMFNW